MQIKEEKEAALAIVQQQEHQVLEGFNLFCLEREDEEQEEEQEEEGVEEEEEEEAEEEEEQEAWQNRMKKRSTTHNQHHKTDIMLCNSVLSLFQC